MSQPTRKQLSECPKCRRLESINSWGAMESRVRPTHVTCIAKLALDLIPMKRNLVSPIGKFYDPLGYLLPVVIEYKILFQQLCQSKIEWDDIISDDVMVEWKTLISDLNEPCRCQEATSAREPAPKRQPHSVGSAMLPPRPMPQWSTFV